MRLKEEYHIQVEDADAGKQTDLVFNRVFRKDIDKSGFALLDFSFEIGSEHLRRFMVHLKQACDRRFAERDGKRLTYQWLGRFDQQETTKLHLDNAAAESFLMLGYEPSEIKSKLFIADYVGFSRANKVQEKEFFDRYNPVFSDIQGLLAPYLTVIDHGHPGKSRIVFLNNSNGSVANGTLGVLHKSEILNRNMAHSRIVNSMMLSVNPLANDTLCSEEQFVRTNSINKNLC